jgi:hypothetical protein
LNLTRVTQDCCRGSRGNTNFIVDAAAKNLGSWIDAAASQVGR